MPIEVFSVNGSLSKCFRIIPQRLTNQPLAYILIDEGVLNIKLVGWQSKMIQNQFLSLSRQMQIIHNSCTPIVP